MNLREKHEALLAMRPFVRKLPAEQVTLFHEIAARYAGPAQGFADAVRAEFDAAVAAAGPRVDELDVRLSGIRALNGGAPADETVARIRAVWPRLSREFREYIVMDIQGAIDDGKVAASELALWHEIRALADRDPPRQPSLDERRLAAAQVAYATYQFDCPVVVDRAVWTRSPSGREWKIPILVAAGEAGEGLECGQFVVRFEDLNDTIAEAYGVLNGEVMTPANAPSMAL